MGVTSVSDLADACHIVVSVAQDSLFREALFTHFISATSGIISIYDKIVKFYAFLRDFKPEFKMQKEKNNVDFQVNVYKICKNFPCI